MATLPGCFPPPHLPDTQEAEVGVQGETLGADGADETGEDARTEIGTEVAAEIESDVAMEDTAETTSACPLGCEAPAAPCKVSRCDAVRGCVVEDAADDSACDDDDRCTTASACSSGLCVARAEMACAAPNDCQDAGACDPSSGACVYPNKDDGVPCATEAGEDGTCKAGSCARLPILLAGGAHVCAIFYDGSMHCWGANESGQLGLGHTDPVGGSAGRSVRDESKVSIEPVTGGLAGLAHTCAWGASGMRCWGAPALTGYDQPPPADAPPPVPDLLDPVPLGAVASQGTGSQTHSCVASGTGHVRCWGIGFYPCHLCGTAYGFLGYPGVSLVGGSGTPIVVAGDVELSLGTPVFVAAQVVVGLGHSCARSIDGEIRCWGWHTQLGIEASEDIGDDEPPSEAALANVGWHAATIAAGGAHTCAVTTDQRLYCWGALVPEALGLGSDAGAQTPQEVDVGFDVRSIALGKYHTCALSRFGTVKCWGFGADGQLGSASTTSLGGTPETVPSKLPILLLMGPVASIAAGDTYSCAVMRTGAIRCWGTGPLGRADDAVIGDGVGDMPPADVPIEP